MILFSKLVAYVQRQLDGGRLLPQHIVALVRHYQEARGLDVDGMPGAATLGELERDIALLKGETIAKVYPLPLLSDGRRPIVTSSFRSRSRPRHNGVDLFYEYVAGVDPVVKRGDGGATSNGKWWIPEGTCAIAAADGVVTRASRIPTGFRVAVEHADGYETIYAHLEDLRCEVGQPIALGHPVGLVGDNPIDHDATHLHFEVTPAGRYAPVDPEKWLAGAGYV